jgi:hypothetical protein
MLLLNFILVIIFFYVPHSFAGPTEPLIIPGCHGEYCFSPCNGKSRRSFNFYEKMDKNSKLIKSFPKGTNVQTTIPQMRFLKPGKYIVMAPKIETSQKVILKKGDILTHRQWIGEGMIGFYQGQKSLAVEEIGPEDIKELEPSVFEQWVTVIVNKKKGYTDSDPFPDSSIEGCK